MNRKYNAAWFHEVIAEKLEDALRGVQEGRKIRIILTIPPRHGKSVLASQYFPAWVLGKEPSLHFILSTYGADLAEKMGQATRDIINNESYSAIFKDVQLREDTKAKRKWMTNKGGSYTAVGIGGAITGIGGDIIILDDPHKDRAEAESPLQRDKVWEYYRSTLYSRLEGYGAIIVIMQRWHTDDLIGRLQEEEERLREAGEDFDEWTVINFPAIAEEDEFFEGVQVREAGDPLWPAKFPLDILDNIRQNQGVYNWASQYQQDPVLAETQEFQEHYFKYYDEEELANKFFRYTTTVDPAISQKLEADNTVILTVAKEVGTPNIYRIREDAGKFTPQETLKIIFKHQAEYDSDVYIETNQYQAALKYSVEEEQRRLERYFTVQELRSQRNKEARIRGLLPLYNAGVIYHRRGDVEYERELLHFPRGKHDDRADAMAMQLEAMENTRASRFAPQFKKKFNGYFRSK